MMNKKIKTTAQLIKGFVNSCIATKEDIKKLLNEETDDLYVSIDNYVGDLLYINWSRFEYIIDFYKDEEIKGIIEWLDIEEDDKYNILYYIIDDILTNNIEIIKRELKKLL